MLLYIKEIWVKYQTREFQLLFDAVYTHTQSSDFLLEALWRNVHQNTKVQRAQVDSDGVELRAAELAPCITQILRDDSIPLSEKKHNMMRNTQAQTIITHTHLTC